MVSVQQPWYTSRHSLHPERHSCKMQSSTKFRQNLNLQQFKVIQVHDFGTNRKRICDFLLVISSNFGSTLHRFWDTATYWLIENCVFFLLLSHSAPPLPMLPLEFRSEVHHEEIRLMGLLCGERCMILTSTIFDWSTRVMDGRTDRR